MNSYAKDYKQMWRLSNAEHIKKYQKEYLDKVNGIVTCEVCKSHFKRYNTNLHEKSKNSS